LLSKYNDKNQLLNIIRIHPNNIFNGFKVGVKK